MHITDVIDAAWLERLSQSLQAPVYVLDAAGQKAFVSKAFPFYCQLLERSGKCDVSRKSWQGSEGVQLLTCHAGMHNIIMPVRTDDAFLGLVVVSSMVTNVKTLTVPESEELRDALQSVHVHDRTTLPAKAAFVELFVNAMVQARMHKQESTKTIKELTCLIEFMEATARSKEITQLLQNAVSFFVHKFKLGNCSIHVFDTAASHFPNVVLKPLENAIVKHLDAARSSFFVKELSTDYMLAGLAKDLTGSMLAVPVLHNKENIGALIMYAEHDLRNSLDLVSLLGTKLVDAVVQISSYKQVEHSARTDKLTSLYNRAFFDDALPTAISRAHQKKQSTALLLFDVDDFKQYNDTKGHPEGDKILQDIAAITKKTVQGTVCRYGGEEFAVILGNTQPEQAAELAELLRAAIEAAAPLTISIGTLTCLNSSALPADMVREADAALYKAKQKGKNQVVNFIMVDKALGVIDSSEV